MRKRDEKGIYIKLQRTLQKFKNQPLVKQIPSKTKLTSEKVKLESENS